MEIREYTLRPLIRLIKVIGIPVIWALAFLAYSFIAGVPSRIGRKQVPLFFQLDLGEWVFIVCLAFLALVFLFTVAFSGYPDRQQSTRISIQSRVMTIESPDFKMTVKRSVAEIFMVKSSWILSILYPRYYRVGRAKIRIKDDLYTITFPIRNMEVLRSVKMFDNKR